MAYKPVWVLSDHMASVCPIVAQNDRACLAVG